MNLFVTSPVGVCRKAGESQVEKQRLPSARLEVAACQEPAAACQEPTFSSSRKGKITRRRPTNEQIDREDGENSSPNVSTVVCGAECGHSAATRLLTTNKSLTAPRTGRHTKRPADLHRSTRTGPTSGGDGSTAAGLTTTLSSSSDPYILKSPKKFVKAATLRLSNLLWGNSPGEAATSPTMTINPQSPQRRTNKFADRRADGPEVVQWTLIVDSDVSRSEFEPSDTAGIPSSNESSLILGVSLGRNVSTVRRCRRIQPLIETRERADKERQARNLTRNEHRSFVCNVIKSAEYIYSVPFPGRKYVPFPDNNTVAGSSESPDEENYLEKTIIGTENSTELGGLEIVRCVSVQSIVVIKPGMAEQYTLNGFLLRRLILCSHANDDSTRLGIMATTESEVLGLGTVVLCSTNTMSILVVHSKDLKLLTDFNLGYAEAMWRDFITSLRGDLPDGQLSQSRSSGAATSVICPSSYGRRDGLVYAGTNSGLVHVWKLPQGQYETILPGLVCDDSEIPGIERLIFSSFGTRTRHPIRGCATFDEQDDASCTRQDLQRIGVKYSRQNLLWCFFSNGFVTLWDVNATSSSSRESAHDACLSIHNGTLPIGSVPEEFQHHFLLKAKSHVGIASVVANNSMASKSFTLMSVIDWREEIFVQRRDKQWLWPFLAHGKLYEAFAVDESPLVYIVIRAEHQLCEGQFALAAFCVTGSRLKVFDCVRFHDIDLLPLTSAPPSRVVVTLAEIPLRSNAGECHPSQSTTTDVDTEDIATASCLIMVLNSMIHVVLVSMPPQTVFQLIASFLVRTKLNFSCINYEENFDELLLGSTRGQLFVIENFSVKVDEKFHHAWKR